MTQHRPVPWRGPPAMARTRQFFPVPPGKPVVVSGATILLAHLDTANIGGIFRDSSSYVHTLITHGSIVTTSSNPHFGSLSAQSIAGTQNYLDTPDSPQWNFGTGDFTLECWYMPYSASASMRLASTIPVGGIPNTGLSFSVAASASAPVISFRTFSSGSTFSDDTAALIAGDIALNTWNHYAVDRTAGTVRIFFNGVSKALTHPLAATLGGGSVPYSGGTTFQIFQDFNGIGGQMQEFRASSIARWTANFTPPTQPYS
jgi:hypothetical protein